MAREMDYGADVAAAGGKVFLNPTPGAHDSIISAVVHIGSYADVFVDGNKKDPKPPCNFVLIQSTLMGDADKNEDGSRIQKWQAMPLKHGDKANLTKFMAAVDPTEVMTSMDQVIGQPVSTSWKANEKKGKNEDGTWKTVNLSGYSNVAERTAKLIKSDAEDEKLEYIGHVKFADLTIEVLEEIPAYLLRQYFLSESEGTNQSYPGSAIEALVTAKRAEDPEWKVKRADDESGDEQQSGPDRSGNGTAGASSVPEAANVEAPADMQSDQEF